MIQSNSIPTSTTFSRSKQLYEYAILELDNTTLPKRIAEARKAMLDRAEEILMLPSSDEGRVLNHSLRTLQLLEEVAARETIAAWTSDGSVRRSRIVDEIETAFDTFSSQPTVVRICKNCGSAMVNLNTTVSLADSERSWNVLLPVCPKCDRDEYLKLISRQAA